MLLDELGSFLASAGVGTVGADLFLAHEPPDPDALIALYEYGGSAPVHAQGADAPALEMPRVQVVARGARGDYAEARARAERAYRSLDGIANRTIQNAWYVRVRALQSPFSLGPDANGRYRIAFNAEITKAPAPV
jgi:hypothetical protein